MRIPVNESLEKHFPQRETVLLKFNKRDSQMVRDWSNSATKDMFDDKN
jgi:hypothetical protein